MAIAKRTVHLAIERVALHGLNPGDRHRFERALHEAFAEGLRDLELRGSLRERRTIRLPAFRAASPESLAMQLAQSVLEVVGEQ